MTVEVKRRDIWFGRRNEPILCPVARALNRATGDRWAVHGRFAMKLFERPFRRYPLPESVNSFVWDFDFDGGGKSQPFSFEFEPR
jgi:hypothetical protein